MRTPFDDAVAVWHLGDLRNGNGADHSSSEVRSAHPLATHGSVQVGVALSGAERQESLRRGGDGRAALFDGDAWLSTGPATGGVDLSAESFTTCVRLRADKPGGVFYTNLFALLIHGDDRGEGLLVAHLGVYSGESALYREVLLGTIRLGVWHDLIVRYRRRDPGGAEGGELSLACDGRIVWLVEIGEHPRAIFAGPTIIGGWRVADPPLPEFPMEIVDGIFQRLFAGAIDHAAFWNRALEDREVAELSGVAALEEGAAEGGAGHDASAVAALAQYNAFYDASRARDVERCLELGREMRRHMARDARRPIYHLTAPMGFIQDPCSAFFHDGRYHVFSFRNILVSLSCTHLDHYVSDDLIHWQDMPVACWADSDSDVYGIWLTNNVIDDDGLPTILYTAHGMRGKIGVLARSTDGMVSFGHKRAVITNRIHHDGHTWRTESDGADRWVTLTTDQYFGARPGDRADRIVALTSPDLERWTERGETWSVTKHPDPQDSPQRWGLDRVPLHRAVRRSRRPDRRQSPGHLLGRRTFDRNLLRFTPDDPEPKLIDYGNPVHCCNPLIVDRKGPGGASRRIILAEHGHARGAAGGAPWHGLHVLPRVLSLHGERLLQEPVREVEALRGRHVARRGLPRRRRRRRPAVGHRRGCAGDRLHVRSRQRRPLRVVGAPGGRPRVVRPRLLRGGHRPVRRRRCRHPLTISGAAVRAQPISAEGRICTAKIP